MKHKKLKISIDVPSPLYNSLKKNLEFSLLNITSTKSKNSYINSYWAISSMLINDCCFNNEDLNLFVNIHSENFKKISSSKEFATKIKSSLINFSGIFECNWMHLDKGPVKFSYGYRINPSFQNLFTSKNSSSISVERISFTIPDCYLIYRFGIDIDTLNGLNGRKRTNSIYIKIGPNSSQVIDNQDSMSARYNDRITLNEYEKQIEKRLSKITVDLRGLNHYEGNDLKKIYWISRIMKHKDNGEVVFSHGRFYRNPYWHCLPKEFRQFCLYEKKSRICEGFDVKNCFATLTTQLLEGNVSDEEFKKFKRIVRTGIYEDIANSTYEYDRNDMKQPFCHWLFSNSTTKKRFVNERFSIVRNYFKNEFPEIYSYLLKYPEIEVDVNGKRVMKSKLSVDCQWIENELVMNTLAKWTEEKFNVEVFTLHDAICCKEEDYLKIDWIEVKKTWYKIMEF